MNWKKKVLSTVTATAVGLSLTLGTPAVTEAAGVGDAAIILAQGWALNKQIDANLKHFNDTEEGRQELYQKFREKYGVCDDYEYNTALDRIMTNLTRGVGAVDPTISKKPYLYFISNQETVNAACSMGHVMMVNVGTFRKITNEDELAAIVGHEMGHGQKDHVAKGQKKHLNKLVVASLAGAAVGGGALTSIVADVVLNNSIAHGDRKLESEADLLGFDYILHTDYNPGACAAVMQKFVEMEIGKNNSSIFNPSDHPDSATRRDTYVKKLFEYSGKHVTAKDGVVTVNKKTLLKVAASADMSSAERSYFVLGNLAVAYHNGQNKYEATVQNGVVMLGNQPIIEPLAGDESAQIIADRLNEIK